VGVALDDPRFSATAEPSDTVEVEGTGSDRVRGYVKTFLSEYGISEGVTVGVSSSIPAHSGLGSGTQTALGAGAMLSGLFNIDASIEELTNLYNRGALTNVGVGVFETGGLVVDDGNEVTNHHLPSDWVFVLVVPDSPRGLSGETEDLALREITGVLGEVVDEQSLLTKRLIPALRKGDIVEFGKLVSEIDAISGEIFSGVQGGIFRGELTQKLISKMIECGAWGAGQSSWGPTVYGLTTKDAANSLAAAIESYLIQLNVRGRVSTSAVRDRGAEIG